MEKTEPTKRKLENDQDSKRKATSTNKIKKSKTEKKDKINFDDGYEKMSLAQIKESIKSLCKRVPTIPPNGIDANDSLAIRDWAENMQAAIEEFSLLLSCLAPATYKWGSDRSGVGDQSLTMLSNEISLAQEQISGACSSRLTNVLAPVVDLVVKRVVKSVDKETGDIIKTQTYDREVVDIEFHKLCGKILCRNAAMLRRVVLGNFHKIVQVIEDYQKAAKKDSQQERSLAY